MFKKFVILLILCAVLFSGCDMNKELRPQNNSNEIWVCEELPNTYFYWDEEIHRFLGNVAYKDASYGFALGGGYGKGVSFYTLDVSKEDVSNSEDVTFLRGFADYQQGIMPVEIFEDKLNIFNGEITTLTFVCKDKAEYFKDIKKTEY